jgi:hypothetical protein
VRQAFSFSALDFGTLFSTKRRKIDMNSKDAALSPQASIGIALALVVLAMLGRFISVAGWGNFTPVAAVALFAGCYLRDRKLALLVPATAMILSDLVIGLHSLLPVVYACFAFTLYLGTRMRQNATSYAVLGNALISSLVFFVVTNFAVWLGGSMYPMTAAGLGQCFVMAIPFFKNELIGTLLYSALLFGGYALYQKRVLNAVRA